MKADSGAERSTIPWSVFQDKLINVCKLVPSSVKLHQYDQSPLTVKGECKVKVRVDKCVMDATFVVVDVSTCYPLFGRDWMLLLGLDLTVLINEATQIHNVEAGTGVSSPDQLFTTYADVFEDRLGVCKILGEKEGIPPLAAARMQHWALLLSAYQYKIQHIPGKLNCPADCMSRLPSLMMQRDSAEKIIQLS